MLLLCWRTKCGCKWNYSIRRNQNENEGEKKLVIYLRIDIFMSNKKYTSSICSSVCMPASAASPSPRRCNDWSLRRQECISTISSFFYSVLMNPIMHKYVQWRTCQQLSSPSPTFKVFCLLTCDSSKWKGMIGKQFAMHFGFLFPRWNRDFVSLGVRPASGINMNMQVLFVTLYRRDEWMPDSTNNCVLNNGSSPCKQISIDERVTPAERQLALMICCRRERYEIQPVWFRLSHSMKRSAAQSRPQINCERFGRCVTHANSLQCRTSVCLCWVQRQNRREHLSMESGQFSQWSKLLGRLSFLALSCSAPTEWETTKERCKKATTACAYCLRLSSARAKRPTQSVMNRRVVHNAS